MKILKIMKFDILIKIKRKPEIVMSWDKIELWWVMILKVIPHILLKKAQLITGSPRIISCFN